MNDDSLPAQGERSGARVLLTPKWIAGHLLALALVLLFINFGFWQLRRLEQRTKENDLVEARMEAEPVRLSSLLEAVGPDTNGVRSADGGLEELAYRRAFVAGTFAPEQEILLRSRSRDGQPGWHLLTPLVRSDGSAVLVDRGWVPRALDEPPVEEAAPPAGQVRAEGIVRLEEDPPEGWAASISPRDPPEGELERAYYVDVDRLAPQYPFDVAPVYLQLTALEPPHPERLPLLPQQPEFSRGPHLSYAVQWFSFALIGLVGYAILLRRTLREPTPGGE
ncbi:MAG TPA: SURF1 family protein [Trueperaceae bacterium]